MKICEVKTLDNVCFEWYIKSLRINKSTGGDELQPVLWSPGLQGANGETDRKVGLFFWKGVIFKESN